MSSVAEGVLRVRPGEGRRSALLFAHLFLASVVFILGRTVRDTLFLSRYPLSALPWMFVLYGLVSAVVAVAYGSVADRMARHRMIVFSTSIGIVTYLATWGLVRARATWIYPAFYVWTEVAANLFIVQFWTLANDLHNARDAKRLFGTIGSARVLGVVACGLGAGAVVRAIGTEQLIFVLAALMVGIALLALALSREPRADAAARAGMRPRRKGPPPAVLRDPYVQVLGALLLLTFTALTLGDYQFKAIARATYREDDLARFFSLFYAGTGAVSFVFQVLVTPRVLARLGVSWGLSVMPAVFGTASAFLLMGPRLAVATVMKFADNGFQYTIHETTLQALYVPFAPDVKARTRAMLDAVVKPLSYGVGGLALVVLAGQLRVPVQVLSAVTVPLVLLWLGTVPLVRRRYLRTLEATISARGALALDHEFTLDAEGRRLLLDTLESGDSRRALLALEELAGEASSDDLSRAVGRLATNPDPALRAAALNRLGTLPRADPEPARAALRDGDSEVRAEAVRAFCALARDEAVDLVAPLLGDESRAVRVAAAAGLLRYGGLEGGIVAGTHWVHLLASPDAAARTEAASSLRLMGSEAYRPLVKLLRDPDPAVRREALRSAASVADPRLVPALIEALEDPSCRRRAARALAAIGPPAVAPLAAVMRDATRPRAVRLQAPRILRSMRVEEAFEPLLHASANDDSHLRLRIFAALSRLRYALRREALPRATIERLVRTEILEAYGNLAAWERARPSFDTVLLEEEFEFRQKRAVRRLLRILELRYERATLRLVRGRLDEPGRRANALEVLDTLLEPSLRPLIMPFLDDLPASLKLRRAAALEPPPPPPPPPAEFLSAECGHPNPYVALLALDGLARHDGAAAARQGRLALAHPDALVREGAVLAVLAGGDGAAYAEIEPLARDIDRAVSRAAQAALARLSGAPVEVTMYSTIEKILLLKSAPLFEKVAGEDLAGLARVAEVETYAAGQTVFEEGEIGDNLYIVLKGRVAIETGGPGGRRLATLGRGETFGEMAVLDAEPRSATARALEETELLSIGSEEFYEILHEQAEIAEGVVRLLTRRLREADRALRDAGA